MSKAITKEYLEKQLKNYKSQVIDKNFISYSDGNFFLDGNKIEYKTDESGNTITNAYIDENYHLIITLSDGEILDAGLLEVNLDYEVAIHKPSINDVQLVGNVSLEELGIHNHNNLDILKELSTDGVDLYFKNVNVTNIVLENGKRNYSAVILNATRDNIYQIGISSLYKECDLVVQSWKFVNGDEDLITIEKYFNNSYKDNFIVTDNVEFNKTICKIKDSYEYVPSIYNSEFYITNEINLDDFVELNYIGLEAI